MNIWPGWVATEKLKNRGGEKIKTATRRNEKLEIALTRRVVVL